MTLINWLEHLDKALFVLIQHDSDHSVLDKIMPLLRDPLTWIPLYAGMLAYILVKAKAKALPFIVLSVLTFAITDSLTAQVLKPLFGRLRPCYDPEMQPILRGLVDCGGFYSMPSNLPPIISAWPHSGSSPFDRSPVRNGIGSGFGRRGSAMRRFMSASTIHSMSSSAERPAS